MDQQDDQIAVPAGFLRLFVLRKENMAAKAICCMASRVAESFTSIDGLGLLMYGCDAAFSLHKNFQSARSRKRNVALNAGAWLLALEGRRGQQ